MTEKNFIININGNGYTYQHSKTYEPQQNTFYLHNHNDMFETLIFITGKANFVVEGSTYTMRSGNIMVVSPSEMHRMLVDPSQPYERIVIMTSKNFYEDKSLPPAFSSRKQGEQNVTTISDTERKIIYDICKKIEYYSDSYPEDEQRNTSIENLINEIIYVLSRSEHTQIEAVHTDERIKNIIAYINDNLTERLTLEKLSEEFFINKYHLCRIFKSATGMTVFKYINYKRLLLANELHSDGKNLTESCFSAGFENYSTFYKLYKSFTGDCPRHGGNIILQKPCKDQE